MYRLCIFVGLAFCGLFLCSNPAHAATSYLNVSANSGGELSFGKVRPSASGVSAATSDTLTVNTNCSVGYRVYVSGQNGKGTSLVNTDPNITTNNTVDTSSASIGSPSALSNNTWGISATDGSTYAGLPSYANATSAAFAVKSDVAEQTTVPVYYGARVTTSIAPGTYTGDILYTVLPDPACSRYTIHFNSNGGTGTMNNQTIPVGQSTPLSENEFTRTNHNFLGWSNSATGKTGTAVDGIGTTADVDYTDKQSVTDIASFNTVKNLYAIWELAYDDDMQNWNVDGTACASLSVGQSVRLRDTRDNKVYAVKKLPDGKCWMMQNLTIGMDGAKTLTPADTNIDNGTTYYLPPAGKQGSSTIDNSSTLTATDTANFTDNSSTDQHAKTQFRTKNTSYTNDSDTGYYNFYTATLGFSYQSDGKTSGSSTRDICPKGWRLPWTSDSGTTRTTTAEFYVLATSYNSSASWTNKPTGSSTSKPYTTDTTIRTGIHNGAAANGNNYAGFSYAGYWYGTDTSASYVGSYGDYWSSSIYDTSSGYLLTFNLSSFYPQDNYGKYYGFAVRCVAKDPLPTMQETTATDLPIGATTALRDVRDNQDYTVYRWPAAGTAGTNYPTGMAGYAIMTKDLSLGYVTGGSVTKGANLSLTTSNSAAAGTITAKTGTGDWSSALGSDNFQYINGTGDYSGRSYYSLHAARIACPKGWRLPTGTEYSNIAASMGGDNSTGANTIKNSPYNFIVGGYFSSSGWSSIGSTGYYWSSTKKSGIAGSDLDYYYGALNIQSSALRVSINNPSWGGSVRCISEAPPLMQEFDSSINLFNTGDQKTLMDARDGKAYTVKRLPDGKVWMTQNLALGMNATTTGLTLTPADTNIDNGTTYYLPPAGKQGSSTIDDSSTLTATTATDFSNSNDVHAKTRFRTKDGNMANDSDTGYYNFYTVTLGFSYYNDSKTSGSSTRDICPKGWRLPKTTDGGSTVSSGSPAEFATLAKSYNSSATWVRDATSYEYYTSDSAIHTGIHTGLAAAGNNYAGFSYAGYWGGTNSSAGDVGSYGNYWSASIYNATAGYRLLFDVNLSPQYYNNKNTGLPARCIAETPTMQDFDSSKSIPTVGNQAILKDARDDRIYTVKRLPDGKV